MRSHVFHRLFTPACARFRQWSLRLLIPGVLALTGGAPYANGSPIQLAPQDLQIELPADSLFGSIPVNRRLTVFIHVPDSPAWQGIPLLARFEIPDTAPYIVPMDMDHHRHGYSTTVDLGRLSSTIGTPQKRRPFTFSSVARAGNRWSHCSVAPSSSRSPFQATRITTEVRQTFRCR